MDFFCNFDDYQKVYIQCKVHRSVLLKLSVLDDTGMHLTLFMHLIKLFVSYNVYITHGRSVVLVSTHLYIYLHSCVVDIYR